MNFHKGELTHDNDNNILIQNILVPSVLGNLHKTNIHFFKKTTYKSVKYYYYLLFIMQTGSKKIKLLVQGNTIIKVIKISWLIKILSYQDTIVIKGIKVQVSRNLETQL